MATSGEGLIPYRLVRGKIQHNRILKSDPRHFGIARIFTNEILGKLFFLSVHSRVHQHNVKYPLLHNATISDDIASRLYKTLRPWHQCCMEPSHRCRSKLRLFSCNSQPVGPGRNISQYNQKCHKLIFKLLDELAILWVVMACYWLWYPEFALPPPYKNAKNGRKHFSHFFILFALVVSALGFLQPVKY